MLLSFESDTEAFYGRLANARKLSQRAIRTPAHRNDSKETAGAWRMNAALREVEFGNIVRARQEIVSALAEAPTRDVSVLAALAFARTGDVDRADLSGSLFVFGMSDMQFCKAQVRAVRPKTD